MLKDLKDLLLKLFYMLSLVEDPLEPIFQGISPEVRLLRSWAVEVCADMMELLRRRRVDFVSNFSHFS